MRFPVLSSAVQDALTPASSVRAPSVNAVVAALAGKASTSIFTAGAAGLVPAVGTVDGTKYLRDDGTWAVPPGGGGGGGHGARRILIATSQCAIHTGALF